MVPTKSDNRFSKNIQDIRQSHKIHQGSNEKMVSGINSKRKNFSCGENPKRYFAITICNSIDATQLYT